MKLYTFLIVATALATLTPIICANDEEEDGMFENRAAYVEVPSPPSMEDLTENNFVKIDITYVDPPLIEEFSCWWEDNKRYCYITQTPL